MQPVPARDRPLLALLDGYSLAYRAFFALPEDLRTTTGQLTNAVYGFTSMLIKLLAEQKPEGLAAVFDRGRPAERLELMPTYKANRSESPDTFKSQLPLIDEVLTALAIPKLFVEGHEADDLIATYADEAVAQGWDVLIVTGDRDAFQVIGDHVQVLYTRRGISDTILMDTAAVLEKYGVEPARYPMLAALRGDPSDNIPGVPGVGDKTASKLLNDFGTLEGIYEHLGEIRGAKVPAMLSEHRDQVFTGHRVATLHRDLPMPAPVDTLHMGDVDADAVRKIFNTLEFRSLWDRLRETVLDAQQERAAEAYATEPEALAAGGLAAWLAALPTGEPVAVMPFVAGRLPRLDTVAIAVAAEGVAPGVLDFADASAADLQALGTALADRERPLLTHDAKALLHVARARGWEVTGLSVDTALAAYLVSPQTRDYDLERLAVQYLGKTLAAPAAPQQVEGQLAFGVEEDRAAVVRDRGLRAQALLDVAVVLGEEVDSRDQRSLLDDIELPLVPVLAEIEANGIAIDRSVLEEMGESLADQVTAAKTQAYAAVGREINLDSPKQLQELLFVELKLPKTKRIKTGWSVDATELTKIVDTHPLIEPLLRYREVSKLKGTYVDALPPLIDSETGRIHAEFNQTVAVTGRLSSQNPNLQNIPIRSAAGREIRRAFVPGQGFTSLLVADYSQIELRVMAHLSGDPGLVDAFNSGEDIHATTAAKVLGIPISAVDGTRRAKIKGMTYGLAYGLSAFGLSQQLLIPKEEAAELMEAYFARFPGVRGYLYGGVEQARRDGWTATLPGRRRYLPDLVSDNRQRREMAERMALNAPIQGTAADIIKMAMIEVHRRMRGMRSRLLLQVHDELVTETAPGEEDALRELLVDAMASVIRLKVPLEVDTAAGPSWAEAEKH